MNDEKMIGRIQEQEILSEYYELPKSEFVALYSRRRVGKTYLVKGGTRRCPSFSE